MIDTMYPRLSEAVDELRRRFGAESVTAIYKQEGARYEIHLVLPNESGWYTLSDDQAVYVAKQGLTADDVRNGRHL